MNKHELKEQDVIMYDTEQLKAYMQLFMGQVSSKHKVFSKSIFIEIDDVKRLNEKMLDKLRLNHVYNGSVIITGNIKYENGESKNFGNFDEIFDDCRNTSKAVSSLFIKWDFLAQIAGSPMPQRHTASIRVNSGVRTFDMLQALFSSSSDDAEKIELNMAPVIGRVDFINSELCDEILLILENWVKSCESSEKIGKGIRFLKSNAKIVADIFRYLISSAFLMFSIWLLEKNKEINAIYLLMAIFVIYNTIIKDFSFIIGREIFNNIREYGNMTTFSLTSGDKTRIKKMAEKNSSIVKSIILIVVVPIILNIISAYILLKMNFS